MKRFFATFAGAVAAIVLLGTLLTVVHFTIGEPVDLDKVCTDTGYGGAYNESGNEDNTYAWRCFRAEEGDVPYPESEMDIAGWCESPVRVFNDKWECIPDWYPIQLPQR